MSGSEEVRPPFFSPLIHFLTSRFISSILDAPAKKQQPLEEQRQGQRSSWLLFDSI